VNSYIGNQAPKTAVHPKDITTKPLVYGDKYNQ